MFSESFVMDSWFFHDKPDLDAEELLFLETEPGNEHDPFAVRITTFEGNCAGYVPAPLSQQVTQLLDSGAKLTAHAIDGYDAELDLAPRVRITDPEGNEKVKEDEQTTDKRHKLSSAVTFGGLTIGAVIALTCFVHFPDLGAMGLQFLAGLAVAGISFVAGLIIT